MRKKTLVIVAGIGLSALALGACGSSNGSDSASQNDTAQGNRQQLEYQKNQPTPMFDRSQYRQTLIDVETAQVHGTATTSFFFNQGSKEPFKSCPSVGFPVSSTSQLTNPDQVERHGSQYDGGNVVIAQQEPNGAFTGDSSGTYVICVAPSGTDYVSYWEGWVDTEGGNAHWDAQTNRVVLDGEPTVKSTENKASKKIGNSVASGPTK